MKAIKELVREIIMLAECNEMQPHNENRVVRYAEKEVPKDGIYLVYNDGKCVPFGMELTEEFTHDVKGIGVIYLGIPFMVALKDLGEWPLVRNTENCPEESSFYKTEGEGLHDWDFITATKHIQDIGTDIPLPKGWYIPTLAVLEVMCFWKEEINEAIIFAGGEPMPDEPHWSVTEYTRYVARSVYFYNGHAGNNYKYNGGVVRPVAAFTYEPR
ncbi:MAG: hypothetical protein IJ767_04005 [Bacteroidaceae bacterium]|nr:hypothetical protein [Bacteroidaceae bacterium]